MQYKTGNIWTLSSDSGWVVVTTNTTCKNDGNAVMGAGIAKDAADKYPWLPKVLGKHIRNREDALYVSWPVICFPTKCDWRQPSSLKWIEKGCIELADFARVASQLGDDRPIYLPKLGCGLGGLNWERDVRPVVDSILEGDRFILVSQP